MTFLLILSLLLGGQAHAAPPSFLTGIDSSRITCGKRGFTFPVLIGGRFPISACMLKYKNGMTNFGSIDF